MQITREWLDAVSDKDGLTIGQQKMLKIWATEPIVGSSIPDHIARFIEKCKGYRGIPDHVKAFLI